MAAGQINYRITADASLLIRQLQIAEGRALRTGQRIGAGMAQGIDRNLSNVANNASNHGSRVGSAFGTAATRSFGSSVSRMSTIATTSGQQSGNQFNVAFSRAVSTIGASITNPVRSAARGLSSLTSSFRRTGQDFGTSMNNGMNSTMSRGNAALTGAFTAAWTSAILGISNLISNSITSAINVAKSALGDLIKVGMEVENSKSIFGTLMGSKEKGNDLFNKTEKFAKDTPYDNAQSIGAVQQMSSIAKYRNDTNLLIKDLTMVGDVAAGTGRDLSQIAYVYTQIQTQGQAMGEDLNQLSNAGIPIIEILAKVMGKPLDQVKKLASEGKVTADVITKAFTYMTSAGGQFSGAMDNLSKITSGKVASMGGSFDMLKGQIFEGLSKPIGVALDAVNNGLSKLIDSGDLVKGLTATFNQMAAMVDKNKVAINALIEDGFKAAQSSLLEMAKAAQQFMTYLATPEGTQAVADIAVSLQGIGTTLGQLGSLVGTLVGWYVKADTAVIKLTAAINQSSETAHQGLVRTVQGITNAVIWAVKLGESLRESMNNFAASSQTAITNVINYFGGLFKSAQEGFKSFGNVATNTFATIQTKAGEFKNFVLGIPKAFVDGFEGVKKNITGIFDGFIAKAKELGNSITNALGGGTGGNGGQGGSIQSSGDILFPLGGNPANYDGGGGARSFGAPRRKGRKHAGIDYTATTGTPYYAAIDGKVTEVSSENGEYQVAISGIDSLGRQIKVVTTHMDKNFVKLGQMVNKGQNIGTVGGSKGSWGSDGAHAHIELHINGVAQGNHRGLFSGGSAASKGAGKASGGEGVLAHLVLSAEQLAIAKTIIERGRKLGASNVEIKSAIAAGLVESGLRNLNHGDRDSKGVFQQRPSQGWANATNVALAADAFYKQLMQTSDKAAPGQRIQSVQRSAHPGKYQQRYGEAEDIFDHLTRGGGSSSKKKTSSSKAGSHNHDHGTTTKPTLSFEEAKVNKFMKSGVIDESDEYSVDSSVRLKNYNRKDVGKNKLAGGFNFQPGATQLWGDNFFNANPPDIKGLTADNTSTQKHLEDYYATLKSVHDLTQTMRKTSPLTEHQDRLTEIVSKGEDLRSQLQNQLNNEKLLGATQKDNAASKQRQLGLTQALSTVSRVTLEASLREVQAYRDQEQALIAVNREKLASSLRDVSAVREQQTLRERDRLALGSGLTSEIAGERASSLDRRGDTFGANAIRRQDAIAQLKQEMGNRQNLIMEQGQKEGWSAEYVNEQLAKLNELNSFKLEGISSQFKSLGATIKENIGQQISSMLEGLLDGTKSLGESLTGLLKSIGKMALQFGIKALMGGIGLGGFSRGGMVENFASGGSIGSAMRRERAESGREPRLIVANVGERVLSAAETMHYNKLFPRGISNFANGGMIGSLSPSAMGGGNNVTIGATNLVINTNGGGTVDQRAARDLKEGINQQIGQYIMSQSAPGGLLNQLIRNGRVS